MSCRTTISPILLLASWSAAATAEPVPVAARQPTAEERPELERLGRLAERWAGETRERHGLLGTSCTIAGPGIERSKCRFQGDGVTVSLRKPGRAPGTPEATLLSLGTALAYRSGRLARVGGGWIRDGDLFEVEAGGRVHVFLCATEPSEGPPVKCQPIGDHKYVLDRLRFPRALYSSGAGFDAAAGRAFADGTIRIWHNGRPVDLKPLIGAAGDFASQDFGTVAASMSPPPPPSMRIGPVPEAEQLETERLRAISAGWSSRVRERNGLTDANCAFGDGPNKIYCSFRLDGLRLALGRESPTVVTADLSFGQLVDRRDGRPVIVDGAWIKAGDLLELEVGAAVYPYLCRPSVDLHPARARCRQVRDFADIARRAAHPRARYRLTDPPAAAALGRALIEGRATLRHNGRPRTLAPLTGAARDYGRADFAALKEAN